MERRAEPFLYIGEMVNFEKEEEEEEKNKETRKPMKRNEKKKKKKSLKKRTFPIDSSRKFSDKKKPIHTHTH